MSREMKAPEAAKGTRWNRREFLQTADAATLGTLVVGGPGHVLAADTHAVATKHDFIFPLLTCPTIVRVDV